MLSSDIPNFVRLFRLTLPMNFSVQVLVMEFLWNVPINEEDIKMKLWMREDYT